MAYHVTAGFDKLADQQFMMDAGAVGGVLGGESLGYLADDHSVAGFDTPAGRSSPDRRSSDREPERVREELP